MNNLYTEWVKVNNLKPMTSQQAKFAKFLLQNPEMISKIGNMEDIFTSVRTFLKNKK